MEIPVLKKPFMIFSPQERLLSCQHIGSHEGSGYGSLSSRLLHGRNAMILIEAYSMTTEAIVTKLMWILGQTKEPDEIPQTLLSTYYA